MAFWKKIFFEERFSLEDILYLSRLLNTSLPLNECLALIETKRNEALIRKMKQRLSAGDPIEEAVKDHLPRRLESYVLALLHSLPLSNALSLKTERRKEKDCCGRSPIPVFCCF